MQISCYVGVLFITVRDSASLGGYQFLMSRHKLKPGNAIVEALSYNNGGEFIRAVCFTFFFGGLLCVFKEKHQRHLCKYVGG